MKQSVSRVFGSRDWPGRVLVGGFLLAVPLVNLWALGQIVCGPPGPGREEGPGGVWRRGWVEGASAWALLGAYASTAWVLGYGLGLVLDVARILAPLKPLLWAGVGFVATLGVVTGWALLAEGRRLFEAADPIEIWRNVRRAPSMLLAAAVIPYAASLLGIWILPQALYLGLWLAVEVARGGLSAQR